MFHRLSVVLLVGLATAWSASVAEAHRSRRNCCCRAPVAIAQLPAVSREAVPQKTVLEEAVPPSAVQVRVYKPVIRVSTPARFSYSQWHREFRESQ